MKIARYNIFLALSITVLILFGQWTNSYAQSPPGDPGVTWIMVTFNQAPTVYSVVETPLRYNKTFAVSFHNDDGIGDIYTEGFPFFTGIQVGNTNYPGLFYTDGCGNDISFKLSSNLFSFSGENGPDMHNPGNGYGAVSWPQLDIMYNNDCAIYNHGISSDAGSDPAFINYSIRRNESYIRRKLYETTPGGVQTKIFVNPNGNIAYSPIAFGLGYFSALNQYSQGVLGQNGGDVNAYTNWLTPVDLYRLLAESTNVMQLADYMNANSINGANYWSTIFTHSLVTNYPLTDFHTDWNYIANTYGRDGLDNVWVASEEEIISYLRVKEATTVTYGLAGNTLLITLNGSIPSDMRFYPLSLLVNANTTITNISFSGGTNTFNGIGQTSSLINLEWDGRFIPDAATLADSIVTIAEQTQTQYDCWIAMDYVYMVSPGQEHNALRDRLCAINGVTYDPGFCETCDFSLGSDTTICQNNCVLLSAPVATGNTYLWSNDSTTQNITVCPADTTTYWVELTTIGGCIASDTIVINVLPAPIVNIGPDQSICINEVAIFDSPQDPTYTYVWSANHVQLEETTSHLSYTVVDTALIRLDVHVPNGCIVSDSAMVNALPIPVVDLGADRLVCIGSSASLSGPVDPTYSYVWFANDVQITGETTAQLVIIITDTTLIRLEVTTQYGCMASDTARVFALELPIITVTPESATLCFGESIDLLFVTENATSFHWFDNTILPNLTYTPPTPDSIYSCWAIATNGFGCTKTDTAIVNVWDNPSFQLSVIEGSDTLCKNDSLTLEVVFQNTVPIQSLIWNDTLTITNPTGNTHSQKIKPTQSGWFTIQIISTHNCIDTDSIFIDVVPLPEMTITPDVEICVGETVTLVATGGESCAWYVGTGLISNTYTLDVSPDTTTTYRAEITGNNPIACVSKDSVVVTVHPKPTVVITSTADSTICVGSTIDLTASGAINYTWSNDQTGNTIHVSPSDTTIFTVIGSIDFGCTDTASITINTFAKTIVSFTGLLPVYCLNDAPSQLVGTPEGGHFSGAGMVAGRFNPSLALEGMHTIAYAFTDANNCISIDSMQTLVIGGLTQIDLGPDSTICPNDFVFLDAGTGFNSYFWSNGETSQTVVISGTDYMAGTSREISVVGVLEGCTASGKMTITIRNDCFIGIGDQKAKSGISIIPNPNDGNFSLIVPNDIEPQRIIISTISGLQVYEHHFASPSNEAVSIHLPERLKGIFFVNLQTSNAVFTSKLVVR